MLMVGYGKDDFDLKGRFMRSVNDCSGGGGVYD